MKLFLNKNLFTLVSLSILFISTRCSKVDDLYKESEHTTTESPLGSLVVPQGFDWSTSKDIDIKLNVHDKYDGKYLYSLELFDKDPRKDGAGLLDAGYTKNGQDWETTVTIPSGLTTIFIKETTPLDEINYYSVKVEGNTLSKERVKLPSSLIASVKANVINHDDPHDAFMGDIVLAPYTYIFEDNWPYKGDYDLNDLVLEVQMTKHINSFNNASGITLKVKILAVGATRKLSAGISILSAASAGYSEPTWVNKNIKLYDGLEPFKDNKGLYPNVVIIAEDVHAIFGKNAGSFIFTHDGSNTPAEQIIYVRFHSHGLAKTINYGILDPFIINSSGPENRHEVHLPWSYPTTMADKSYIQKHQSKTGVLSSDPYLTKDHYPFALAIPGSFKYPLESIRIDLAYPKFLKWVTSGGVENQDWFKSADSNFF